MNKPEKLSRANLRAARDHVLSGDASPLFVALLRGFDYSREAHDRDGATLIRTNEQLHARTLVTPEAVARAGLTFPLDSREGDSPRALAWVKVQPSLRYSVAVGIYAVAPDGEKLVAPAEDEYHFAQWRGLTGRRFVRFNAATINTLAQAVGRPPLDVLDEIAGRAPDQEPFPDSFDVVRPDSPARKAASLTFDERVEASRARYATEQGPMICELCKKPITEGQPTRAGMAHYSCYTEALNK